MKIKAWLASCLLSLLAVSAHAIVGGIPGPIPADHPASYNTVALVKPADASGRYKIFCSGSVLSESLILTAKHCIADLTTEDFLIYFGTDTNQIEPRWLRRVSAKSVYGPSDWRNSFPSFDLAWAKIQGGLPKDLNIRPLPLLTEASRLHSSAPVYMAGHGNQSLQPFHVIAGERKHVQTQFKAYMDTPQVASLVLLEGTPGHSNCHGDSGGPAYVRLDNRWYIFGAAAGFDVALTPKSYKKLDDKDFPYVAYCDRAQTLYTFAGDYIDWLQESSGENLAVIGAKRKTAPGIYTGRPDLSSFARMCETVDFRSPGWMTLRQLLIQAMEKEPDLERQQDIFLDCRVAEEKVATLVNSLSITDPKLWRDLTPLQWLRGLKSLAVSGASGDLDLSPLLNTSVETLRWLKSEEGLSSAQLEVLGQMKSLRSLSINGNKVRSLQPLRSLTALQKLDVSDNELRSLDGIESLGFLTELIFTRNQVESLEPLQSLSSLKVIVANDNRLVSPLVDMNWPGLREAYFAGNRLSDIGFLKSSLQLERLRIGENPIPADYVFPTFPKLKRLQR